MFKLSYIKLSLETVHSSSGAWWRIKHSKRCKVWQERTGRGGVRRKSRSRQNRWSRSDRCFYDWRREDSTLRVHALYIQIIHVGVNVALLFFLYWLPHFTSFFFSECRILIWCFEVDFWSFISKQSWKEIWQNKQYMNYY